MGLTPELISRLPEPTRPKAFAIADARVAAHGAVRAAGERVETARHAVELAEGEWTRWREHAEASGWRLDPEIEAKHLAVIQARKAELTRLRAAELEASERFQQAAALDDRLSDYLRGLPAGAVLRHAAAPPPKGPADKAVMAARADLDRLQAERQQVELAPATAAALKAAMAAAVDAAARPPHVDQRIRDDDPTKFADGLRVNLYGASLVGDAGAGFFVWLMRDQIVARLADLIGDRDAPGALTDAQRAKRLREIDAEILSCERREEACIVAAEAIGMRIPRRPDASVLAILEIEAVE